MVCGTKMNPNTLKEENNSGLCCDIILVGCQNGHLRDVMNNHKYTSFDILG